MHGFSSGYTSLVNAEVDSMGGVVDGGVGIGTKFSPHQVAIEKAQAELRLEYDVREERRRELEFLEKGGNPLDFKFGIAASLSVHSTSQTDQHPDQFLTSEAKGSFALTASPHGDSVESSGRLGVTAVCDPNSADNFDAENELLEIEKKSAHPGRCSITPSEHSSQLDGGPNIKDSEDSPVFQSKKGQAYRRRNRSRPNRDGPRSSSVDVASFGSHGLASRQGIPSNIVHENQFDLESDGIHTPHSSTFSRSTEHHEGKVDALTPKDKEKELQSLSLKAEEAGITANDAHPDLAAGKENIVPVEAKGPCPDAEKTDENTTTVHLSESGKMNGEGNCPQNEGLINNAVQNVKALDSESSCTQNSIGIDGNGNIRESYTILKNVNGNGSMKEHELSADEKLLNKQQKLMSEKHVTDASESGSCVKEQTFISHQGNVFANKDHEEFEKGKALRDEGNELSKSGEQEGNKYFGATLDIQTGQLADSIPKVESSCSVKQPPLVDPSCHKYEKKDMSVLPSVVQPQTCVEHLCKVIDKAYEDRILEEARIIEVKHKRIAELSTGMFPREYQRKSHWDFVLEEMAWLANDFAQERLWKIYAAGQICHRVAFASRLRLEEQNKCWKQKNIAHTLAKAVMGFWQSAQLVAEDANCSRSEKCIKDAKIDELPECRVGGPDKDKVPDQKLQSYEWKPDLPVHKYAVRFLQSNCTAAGHAHFEVPGSTDEEYDMYLPECLWQDQMTEENLFYVVPLGATETYRKSIESCLAEAERTGNNSQEEVDSSIYDAATGLRFQDDDFGEDEGENVYYLPGAFDTRRPSKKKRKNLKSCAVRPYESGGDFSYNQSIGTPRSTLMGKRPSNNLHVGPIPTKRMRTASRQRVVGPFGFGSTGVVPTPSRADVSSGETNSFQDDQSTLHGGSALQRGYEADSTMDFDKQFTYDSIEISAKPKKKKKTKYQGSAYDHRWQLESPILNEQKDYVKKRLDSCQLESNGNSGLFGQQAKKPKIMKLSMDSSFENTLPVSGLVASPVASQMSNMSNQSKIIKLIARDKGRKAKTLKVPAGQTGLGSPWTLFEDQALVVLVHDMGPNWELVSDAINSTLQFKCIFRKPQECKERHKILMDRNSNDGADSAEDSGSSQPYPSTLPGIPKGSARQLFQRLQGPMEEDTIKSHFEKIIRIGQQLHHWKKQNNNPDLRQIAPVHGSHVVALSQVFPNNVNGGILTPLDLCDTSSNQDMLPHNFQGSHAGGLSLPNQGSIPSMHPLSSGLNSSFQGVQGPPSMGMGNNIASTSQFSSPRDARLSGLRPGSLSIEEQQRLQQYNHMLSGRNIQAGSLTSSAALSGADRGICMLPSGNGVGMMAATNRSMPMPRPGLQGINSSSMLNSGSVLPSNMSMHSGVAVSHGNSMFRPRDALQMVRMHGNLSNSNGVSSVGGLNSGLSTQVASPVQTYSSHHHHQQQHPIPQQHSHVLGSNHSHLRGSNHSSTPDQQALLRLRERQLKQRLLQRQQQKQQQQHQHQQTSPQHPVSSPVQSNSQAQLQASLQPELPPLSPSSPMTSQPQQQPRQQVLPHGAASGMMNQVSKQRQRQLQQQYQQSSRQHPQQRQLSQPQQQAKILKGIGRSNMLMNQNLPADSLPLNGNLAKPQGQVADKGEQPVPIMQGQNLYSGTSINTMQQPNSLVSPGSSNHSQSEKPFSNVDAATTKQLQRMPSLVGSSNQSQVPVVTSASQTNQGVSSAALPSLSHQQVQGQLKPSLKVANRPQPALQRPIQPSGQVKSDHMTKSQNEHALMEQQFPNSTSKGSASAISTACVDSTSVSTSSGPIGSPPPVTGLGNEPAPSVSEGLAQKQLSGDLVSHGHKVGSQWQQQKSLLKQPSLQKKSQQSLSQLE